eukprot:638219-Pyramimonas_sp.AAC.1
MGISLAVLGRSRPGPTDAGAVGNHLWGHSVPTSDPLGALRGPSLRPSWASWRPLRPSCGPLGAVSGAFWA